jgi:hypothetical protein
MNSGWLFMSLLRRIRDYFKQSQRAHLRSRVNSLREAINLIDRFIDGNMHYPLAWDDFISWENENPSVEALRDKVADLELKLVSKNREQKRGAARETIRLRNHYAGLIGIPSRSEELPW